ncbi:MAG: phenylalanine--tRNA ligase subunit beta [Elusimicrobiota bacterium]|jgi:phenylalanyl-tRNA synthetase beta chain|nr:phenylalanine--tRNA ligase subunit beta [Elusimicrobiota bacterium]
MKILYSWLKDYIDVSLAPAELEKMFTALGIEVAQIQNTGADFEGVYAARIEKIERHPNADKLSLVTLAGKDGTQRVVCGAKNLVQGDMIPLARVGARLGKNVLEAAQIRGIVSEGMICSADELGLTNTRQKGIMVLDKNTPVGQDIAALYGRADIVFDLEISSNRPDLLSHLGIARELGILLNLPLKKPDYKAVQGAGPTLKINIEAVAEGCARYAGRSIKNVKNTQSPQWLRERLAAMGANPKNALVDITNYVLYDIGYPLHAFDADRLESGEINVRWAAEGEGFTGLDGVERVLTAQTLVIADGKKPVALAGVLGGRADSIGEDTKNVFLEAAWFYPPAINKTAKKLGISTEASQRFERGVDIESCLKAMALATKLITEICGGEVSEINDVYTAKYRPAVINFKPEDIAKILGMDIGEERLKQIFTRLAAEFEIRGDTWVFTAPSYRRDLNHKWDLAEEAARYHGLDNLASGEIRGTRAALYFAENPKSVDIGERLAGSLVSLGFFECRNFDFVSLKDINAFGFDAKNVPEIKNPLAAGMEFMRPALLASLLKNIEYNHRQSRADLALFEYGKTFALQKGYPQESWAIAGATTGLTPRIKFFGAAQKPADFYYIKGAAEFLLEGFENIALKPCANAPVFMHPKICMDIIIEGKSCGVLGKIHPLAAKAYGIKTDVWAFEFGVKALERQFDAQKFKAARDINIYPSSRRDLSVLLDKTVKFESVRAVLAQAAPAAGCALVDLYEGAGVPEGKKSITLRFEFSAPDHTLTDQEISAQMATALGSLQNRLGAALR